MKKSFSILFLLFIGGCGLILNKPDDHRYFLVNYKTNEVWNGKENYGAFWFKSKEFPSKNYLDSSIYSCLEKAKDCYEHIIITNIYEFKDSNDFNAFGKDYKGTWTTVLKHDSSCGPFGNIQLGGILHQETKISGEGFKNAIMESK